MNKIIRIGKSEYHRNEIPEQKQTESTDIVSTLETKGFISERRY